MNNKHDIILLERIGDIMDEKMGNIVIYKTEDGKDKIEVKIENNTVWLNQKQLCDLFNVSKSTMSFHINNILKEGELDKNSVVRFYRTTALDGKIYNVLEYSHMDEIIATKAKLIEMETAAFYSCLKIMNKSGMALLLVSDNSQKKKSLVEKTIDDQNRYNYIRSNIIKKSIKLLI